MPFAFPSESVFAFAGIRGILTHGNHMLSVAHKGAIIDETLPAYAEVFAVLADAIASGDPARRLEGRPMQAVIRQS